MPVPKPPKMSGKNGKPFDVIINEFRKGTITLLDQSRIPQDGVAISQNMMLDQDGVWRVRPGSAQYGQSLTGPIDGMGRAAVYSNNGTQTNYLFVIDNGALKYCKDGGTWTTVAGNTWTTGYAAQLNQINSRLYITNGQDSLSYLDLGTFNIVKYTQLSTPGTITLTASTGGSPSLSSAQTYPQYYKITAVKNSIGETAASAEATISVAKLRDNWVANTDSVTLSWSAVANADSYNIYYSNQSGQEIYLDSTAATSYADNGTLTANPYQAAPATDGTAGPPFAVSRWSGNRPWFVGDPNHPYRVWFGGTGTQLGSLNPFYGAGYVDLNLGGNEKVMDIQHYRNGSGTQVAVIFTSSPEGGGSVWFITLGTLTASSISVVVPNALPQGTIGTTSVRGQVQAYNNIYYPSIRGFQSIGSAPNIINVIMTTDISAIIRPSVQNIPANAANQICGIYYFGRIYWSVPYGSSTNNQIWVLDLERQAWTINWTLGVKQFLDYSDSAGNLHLLAIPVSGNNLIEISDKYSGDSGVAFNTNLQSGLVYIDKNHFEWDWVSKIYAELGHPKGNIKLTISGAAPNKSLSLLKSIAVTSLTSSSGFGEDQFGTVAFGQSAYAPQTFSDSSVKKVLYINKKLNYLTWQISSSDINQSYSLLELGITGNVIPSGDPSTWRH